jgi:hypothetical protein
MITEIAYYLFFGFSMVSMVLFLYHVWGMCTWRNIREERRTLAIFLAPFLPFMSEVFTEKGKAHRSRAGWYLIWVVIFLAVTIFIDSYRRGLILGRP